MLVSLLAPEPCFAGVTVRAAATTIGEIQTKGRIESVQEVFATDAPSATVRRTLDRSQSHHGPQALVPGARWDAIGNFTTICAQLSVRFRPVHLMK